MKYEIGRKTLGRVFSDLFSILLSDIIGNRL